MDAVTRKRLRAVASFTLMAGVVGVLIGTLFSQLDEGPFIRTVLVGLAVGVTLGCSIGVGEEFFLPRFSRQFGYYPLNAVRFFLYFSTTLFWLIVINAAARAITFDMTILAAALVYVLQDTLVRDVMISIFAAVAVIAIVQIRSLHNQGEILRLLLGKYFYPEEENRVILYADLEGSTTLAERVGPKDYSRYLRDCFMDISEVIQAWGGQVYQYLGDGIIITWPYKTGFRDAACLRCYFEVYWLLEARYAHYSAVYDAMPRFRVGIHCGPVIVTWVGEAKRELAFHGDVINATARIQSMCNDFDSFCIVSEDLLEKLDLPKGMKSRDLGEISLRGRKKSIRLFDISQ